MPLNIVYTYDGDWPMGATRVAKETAALIEAGHNVTLISRNDTRGPRRTVDAGMEVRRLPALPGNFLNRTANFPFPFNPLWLREIRNAAIETQADVIFSYDLPIAPSSAKVASDLGLPLLYDMAEVYPLFTQGLIDFGNMGVFSRWVRNPRIVERVEDWILPQCRRIFVVTEESKTRCVAKGVRPEIVDIVGNTPANAEQLATPQPVPAEIAELGSRPLIVFTGILIGDRGVVGAVQAMKLVVQQHPDAVLLIVGDGEAADSVRAEIKALELESSVLLTGWKLHDELPAYVQHADIGLLPFKDGIHIRITLANKLFDYMGAGLPFVATDVPPMRRIAEETGAGLLCRPDDPSDLAKRIVELLDDPKRAEERGRRGADAVRHRYSWTHDAARLVAGVEAAVLGPL